MKDREKIRRTLRALAEGREASLGARLREDAQRLFEECREWVEDPSVLGFGVSRKRAGGERQDRMALKVYVRRKRPKERVSNPVPDSVRLVGSQEQVVTDVVEVGDVKLESALEEFFRPAMPGASVGHAQGAAGSLGFLAKPRDGENRTLIVSCSHVIGAYGFANEDDPVTQPAPGFADSRPIALFRQATPFRFTSGGFPNVADAAIAELPDPAAVDLENPRLGRPSGIWAGPQRGAKVRILGAPSGEVSQGEILDVDATLALEVETPESINRLGFRDLVRCTNFTQVGDSGSMVLSSGNKIAGLHIAGSDEFSFFCKIRHVISRLDIEPIF